MLAVAAGSTVQLYNGVLALPSGCVLMVNPGATLELNQVKISGRGTSGHGLVSIRGEGAVATMKGCHVEGTRRLRGSTDAVLVADGGKATLEECTLTAPLVMGSASGAQAAQQMHTAVWLMDAGGMALRHTKAGS
jgi:hypothetical protein